jgi:hypothetical protein
VVPGKYRPADKRRNLETAKRKKAAEKQISAAFRVLSVKLWKLVKSIFQAFTNNRQLAHPFTLRGV